MAQLGARLNGIQKVSGSIPLGSTNKKGQARRRQSPGLLVFELVAMDVCPLSGPGSQGFLLGPLLTRAKNFVQDENLSKLLSG